MLLILSIINDMYTSSVYDLIKGEYVSLSGPSESKSNVACVSLYAINIIDVLTWHVIRICDLDALLCRFLWKKTGCKYKGGNNDSQHG